MVAGTDTMVEVAGTDTMVEDIGARMRRALLRAPPPRPAIPVPMPMQIGGCYYISTYKRHAYRRVLVCHEY